MRNTVYNALIVRNGLPCKLTDGIRDVGSVLVQHAGKVDQCVLLRELCVLAWRNSEQDVVVCAAGDLKQKLLVGVIRRQSIPLGLVAREFFVDFPCRLLLIVISLIHAEDLQLRHFRL